MKGDKLNDPLVVIPRVTTVNRKRLDVRSDNSDGGSERTIWLGPSMSTLNRTTSMLPLFESVTLVYYQSIILLGLISIRLKFLIVNLLTV